MSAKRKAANISSNEGDNTKEQATDSARTDDPNNEVTKSTIFVKNLPKGVTTEIQEFFSDIGPVRKIILVTDKGSKLCNGLAYVNYTFPEDAETAIKKFHNKNFFDTENKVKVERAKKRDPRKGEKPTAETQNFERKQDKIIPQRPQTPQKPTDSSSIDLHTIIIRNIPFKATEGTLNDAFAKFGKIEKVTIPMKKDDPTKMKGFAIIRFKNIASAKKAVEQMNAKEIMKRTIAVDFMLPSNVYQEQVNKKKQDDIEKQEEEWENERENEIKIQDDQDELDDDDDDDDEEEKEEADDDDDENDDEEEEEENSSAKPFVDKAVLEGRVLFIKNLSFDTNQDDLKQRFSEYGNVAKVFLVMDHVTERPRGTAFVHFSDVSSVEKVLQDAYKNAKKQDLNMHSSIELDGRPLIITKAVTRETAANIEQKRKNKHQKEDKRNLYLALEGHIEKDSPAAEGLSKEDLEKRAKFHREKMLKLKNTNFSVSTTRLSVRNIPKNVSEKDLRKIFVDASENAHIKQVKILTEETSSGEAKSKGIGFIEFADHNHALTALRNVNNNPSLFGPKKRPIVEFAIDDARRIHVMQVKREKENNERKQRFDDKKRNNFQRNNEKKPRNNNEKRQKQSPSKQTTPKQSPAKQSTPKQEKEKPPKKKLKREERLEQKEEEAYQKLVNQYKQNYFGL